MTDKTLHRLTLALALTACAVLMPGAAGAASEAAPWATADGSSPSHFQDHGLGHDGVQGPNGTHAVGRWTGNARHGAYSGFNVPAATWTPTVVRVVLHGFVTAPVQHNQVDVYLNTSAGNYGPLTLSAARLNQQVGMAQAGAWVVDFSTAVTIPAGAVQGAMEVDIRLVRQGPDGGAELHLDAVGFQVRLEDPDETFDLWLGADASMLDAGTPHRHEVDARRELDELLCAAEL